MQTATAFSAPAAPVIFDRSSEKLTPKNPNELDPRASRFGFIPIWGITGLVSNAFRGESLPGSRFMKFGTFEFPVTGENDKNRLIERTPLEQVRDLYAVAGNKFATDFPELANLENEDTAREIISLLANPTRCPKYGIQLENSCATCWVAYLRGDAPKMLADYLSHNDQWFNAAAKTLERLLQSLENALSLARGQVDEALRAVDDPKSGKDRFYDVDWINIWNTHQDAPQLKTSTNSQTSIDELAKAMAAMVNSRSADTGLSAEQIQAMIDKSNAAKDARIAELEAKLAAAPSTYLSPVCTGTTSTGNACKATPEVGSDRCKHHPKENENEG